MLTKDRVRALVARVEQGQVLEAIEEFYDADVVMQDNNNPPTAGRQANLERERAFFGAITVREQRALSVTVDGDRAAINWLFDFTGGDGKRYVMDQIAHQTWRDGKIVRERFYYDSATVAAA
jgi:ketosteroid isomerase-like protein